MTPTMLPTLRAIAALQQRCTIHELAVRLGRCNSATAARVAKLRRDGLIECPYYAASRSFQLTDAGYRALRTRDNLPTEWPDGAVDCYRDWLGRITFAFEKDGGAPC